MFHQDWAMRDALSRGDLPNSYLTSSILAAMLGLVDQLGQLFFFDFILALLLDSRAFLSQNLERIY